MTTRALPNRDAKAKSAIESVVRKELAGLPIERIIVSPRENHSGEPALYVLVVVDREESVPKEPEQNRLVGRMRDALDEIDDSRFPYLHFGFNYLGDGRWVSELPSDEDA